MEHQQQSEGERHLTKNDTFRLNERPDSGETFTAEIDRVSGAGNGIIETGESHINIGPVIQDDIDKEITAKIDDGIFAWCLSKSVRVDDYETQYGLLSTPSSRSRASNHPPPIKQRFATEISGSTFCSQCGSTTYPNEDGSRLCSSCGYNESGSTTDGNETETDTEPTDDLSEEVSDRIPIKEDTSVRASKSSRDGSSSEGEETVSSDSNSGADIDTLREKAVESAVEEVPEGSTTLQHEKTYISSVKGS